MESKIIVGIGASAGGLEALERLFANAKPDVGIAYVVIQHLPPDFESQMDQILARHTNLPIRRATHNMPVEADCIYLNPARQEMILADGQLLITNAPQDDSVLLPIDRFLRSLAQNEGDRGVAVILSGTGSDGSRGVKEVHNAGGFVIAQEPQSAQFDGMPQAAINTGLVDLTAEPAEIFDIIHNYQCNPWRKQLATESSVDDAPIRTLFQLLQEESSIEFQYYKTSTISRRLQRRMQLQHCRDVNQYLDFVRSHPSELHDLYQDMLIGVTEFFRDKSAWDELRKLLPEHIAPRISAGEELRVWTTGCATGEEAYSLAILLLELANEHCWDSAQIRILATDVDRRALDRASNAIYSEAQVENISERRRSLFFRETTAGWIIAPEVRKIIVFAHHNVMRDAPFTNLHLIICRNLLIYLQPEAQQRVLSLFHFGLTHGGLLFLGSSETPGELTDEFEALNESHRIFRKLRDVRLAPVISAHLSRAPTVPQKNIIPARTRASATKTSIPLQDALLERFMPPSVVVNRGGEIIHSYNGGIQFMNHRDGRYSMKLLDLVNDDLRLLLTAVLMRSDSDSEIEPVTFPSVTLNPGTGIGNYNVTVTPIDGPQPATVVSFHETTALQAKWQQQLVSEDYSVIEALESELLLAKQNLNSTIEQLESGNEELQSTNEELVSANEELQSTIEELNSVNEELFSVNSEYQSKIRELEALTNDMDNLLLSTEVHTVFVDRELCIRKFTPTMAELFGLLPVDVGRRIDNFRHTIQYDALIEKLEFVIESGQGFEEEVNDQYQKPFLMRLLPYLVEQRIDGAVLTLIDIAPLKEKSAEVQQLRTTMQELQDAQQHLRRLSAIIENIDDAVIGMDLQGTIETWNHGAERLYQYTTDEAVGNRITMLFPEDELKRVESGDHQILSNIKSGQTTQREVIRVRKDGRHLNVSITISPIRDSANEIIGASSIARDITERVQTETELKKQQALFRRCVIGSTDGIWDWEVGADEFYFSPRFIELLGFEQDELPTDRNFIDRRFHPEDYLRVYASLEDHLADSQKPHDVEFRVKTKSDEYRWFRVRGIAQRDDDGRTRIAGSISDIHERKQLEFSLLDQLAQRDRFLAMLSHELRNPLAGILNASFVLQQQEIENPTPLQLIDRQTEHMGRLLDDLLDVSRITQGRFELRNQAFDLRVLIEDMQAEVADQFARKGVTLLIDKPDQAVPIFGDPTRLQQAQVNLLVNACKFTPEGGHVRLSYHHDSNGVAICVEDDGCGLSEEDQNHVFDLFYQAEAGTSKSRKGLGIGLSLVSFIAREHNGSVEVSSSGVGAGAEFVIRLPPIADLKIDSTSVRSVDNGIYGILLVDDAEDSRKMLAESLRILGHSVIDVGTGEAALEQCELRMPQVIVLDIDLPGLSGYEVAQQIRLGGKSPRPLIIAMTGFGREEDRQAALAAGCDVHVVKPTSPPEIVATIKRALDGK